MRSCSRPARPTSSRDPRAVAGAARPAATVRSARRCRARSSPSSVAVGATVARGAPLVTLEAMKMEHALAAPFDGVVAEVAATVGEQVSEGVLLARVEAAP